MFKLCLNTFKNGTFVYFEAFRHPQILLLSVPNIAAQILVRPFTKDGGAERKSINGLRNITFKGSLYEKQRVFNGIMRLMIITYYELHKAVAKGFQIAFKFGFDFNCPGFTNIESRRPVNSDDFLYYS